MVDWNKARLKVREVFEVAAEYRKFRTVMPELRAETGMPHGDGHPVLVIPGFTSPDLPLRPLRRALNKMGYRAYGWKGGINAGLRDKTIGHLYNRLKEIYEENGHRKVSLIGHSMGGIYARCLAHEFPDMVRSVITIGTPFGIGLDTKATPSWILRLIEMVSDKRYTLKADGISERLLTPPPVPTTSIFSKADTIAGWQACLNPKTRRSENIEVASSHVSMIYSKEVLAILIDRLAQPEGKWRRHNNASRETPPPNPRWKPDNTEKWRFFPQPS